MTAYSALLMFVAGLLLGIFLATGGLSCRRR
jgi:hypothetical protein